MTRKDFENWCRENGTGHKVNKSCNGIDWVFVTIKDGWIAIFEYDYCKIIHGTTFVFLDTAFLYA